MLAGVFIYDRVNKKSYEFNNVDIELKTKKEYTIIDNLREDYLTIESKLFDIEDTKNGEFTISNSKETFDGRCTELPSKSYSPNNDEYKGLVKYIGTSKFGVFSAGRHYHVNSDTMGDIVIRRYYIVVIDSRYYSSDKARNLVLLRELISDIERPNASKEFATSSFEKREDVLCEMGIKKKLYVCTYNFTTENYSSLKRYFYYYFNEKDYDFENSIDYTITFYSAKESFDDNLELINHILHDIYNNISSKVANLNAQMYVIDTTIYETTRNIELKENNE